MELQKLSQCYCKLSGPKPERPSKPYLKYILTPQHISKKMKNRLVQDHFYFSIHYHYY